ncbi:DUF6525 family protein [Lentibacter sp. XHP0401]|jgi:Family of unknown function (DUF6525)|uniref:DUF6525 family protein n=1 Tax=Lentibacter sp. XHP0401 TaxID=2984334 RepID=UPI0021E7FA9B|nr:DUF6525 family protein [Lentibacter sp. XHP0401]MCV2894743.1 DUF6525 family protein [Lentibacter sp. XHP0401]
MTGNLGATSLRRRKSNRDPMQTYDTLPPPLRHWLANAAMPWSPASCKKIWRRAKARGEPVHAILDKLDRSEKATLAKGADKRTHS